MTASGTCTRALPLEPPAPAPGCDVCAALDRQRAEALARGDGSRATDCNVEIRQPHQPPPRCASPTPKGLDAASMRRVAGELGCGTMSLYNSVPSKEDLYELMVDAVSGEYDLPEAPSCAGCHGRAVGEMYAR